MISLVVASSAVSFTTSTNIVTLTGHTFKNGDRVRFLTILTTTGISTNTWYFVTNKATNTFQLTTTWNYFTNTGGAVIALNSSGTGTLDVPCSPASSLAATTIKRKNAYGRQLAKQFSPVSTNTSSIGVIKQITNNIRLLFTPVSTVAASSARARITSIISDLVGINSITALTTTVSIRLPKILNIIKPRLFSSITNLPAPVSIIVNLRDVTVNLKFTAVQTAKAISSNVIAITSISSNFIKTCFAKTANVVSWKLPDPNTTWSQVAQQVKTLIQFWS